MKALITAVLITAALSTYSQNLLNREISLNLEKQPVANALEILSNNGNFYFSYNSNIISRDSLISVNATNKPLRQILSEILGPGFEYRESGNYIILRRAPLRLKLVTSSSLTEDRFYVISGFVIDDQTGEKIKDASVYEKDRLVISSTNEQGYFRLRLKNRYKTAAISVSKEYYEDTSVIIQPGLNQTLTITLVPVVINEKTVIIGPQGLEAPGSINLEIPLNDSVSWMYRYIKADSFVVEKTAVGKWLVSSRQKLQSINLKKFFVARPYQVSVIPGVSTNGKLNSQVINNFSFNIFGGYSGGTNGFELGGLFNIDKKDAQYAQIGGLTNIVGGHVSGLQIAGISNSVLGGATGFQTGGVNNFVKKQVSGMQLAGVYNHSGATLNGVQVAGVANFVNHHTEGVQIAGVANVTNHYTKGVQIAGVANISSREMKGVQVAGVFNYTRRLKGLQIGLINVSDSSSGCSVGLINIVFRGYHKLSFSTNEIVNLNAAFKTGHKRFYNIFLGGYNSLPDEKVWSFGYGLGSELISGRRISFNLEATCQHLYLGSWEYYNLLNRAGALVNFKFGRYFSVYAGPVYSVYVSDQDVHIPGFKQNIPPANHQKLGNTVTGWFGWVAGVNLF